MRFFFAVLIRSGYGWTYHIGFWTEAAARDAMSAHTDTWAWRIERRVYRGE